MGAVCAHPLLLVEIVCAHPLLLVEVVCAQSLFEIDRSQFRCQSHAWPGVLVHVAIPFALPGALIYSHILIEVFVQINFTCEATIPLARSLLYL